MSSKVLLTFVHNFWWGVDFWTRSTSSVNQKEILNTSFIYFQFKLKIKYFTVQWNDNTGEVENNPKIHMSCINGKDKILFSLYQSIREENKIISKDKISVCHLEETRTVLYHLNLHCHWDRWWRCELLLALWLLWLQRWSWWWAWWWLLWLWWL